MDCFAYDISKSNFEGGIEYEQHKILRQRNSRREAIPYRKIAVAQREEIPEEQEAQTLASKAHAIIASVGIQMGMSTADWMTVRTMAAGSR